MSDDLTSYWNDHLAGSVGTLELVDRLIETYKGKPLDQFFKDLRNEIDADQGELQNLIEKLGEKESAVRKAGLWVAEKLSRPKRIEWAYSMPLKGWFSDSPVKEASGPP